ncbi:exocyst complex component Sec10-like protein [Lipomyces kononenkoae]
MPAKSPTPRTAVNSGDLQAPRPSTPRRWTSSSLPPIFAVSPDKERLMLPPVIYQSILSYLPLGQYVGCAEVSRAFRQIVYDDAGWIERLRKMKVWDDGAAASFQSNEKNWTRARAIIMQDLASKKVTPLNVLETVHSIPGYARHEFARVYKMLAPLYFDLTRPTRASQFEPQVFKIYRTPELQALAIRTLTQFSNSLTGDDADERRQRLYGITEIFENAAIRELEAGLDAQDYEGRACRYAMVLTMLNGGSTAVQAFIQRSKLLLGTVTPGTSTCFRPDEKSAQIKVDLEPVKAFLRQLSDDIFKEAYIIRKVFNTKNEVIEKATLLIVERVIEDILGDYCVALVDRAHEIDIDLYLMVVSGTYEALLQFAYSLLLEDPDTDDKALRSALRPMHLSVHTIIDRIYEQHIDLYLQEELDRFRSKCDGEVSRFDRKAAQQEQEQETILRNKYRELAAMHDSSAAEKFDFLTSFKKVLFLPVVAIGNPVIHVSSSSSRASSSMKDDASDKLSIQTGGTSKEPLPSTELAANAAILNSRLASIRSLFSLEVALDLIQAARESIERTALFVLFEGQTGEEAKEQCQLIFSALLEFLGFHHIQNGFERALSHLTEYRPPTTTHDGTEGERPQQVEPLVTFLELVNVGDLIQQMVDVFYEKELVSRKFVDRTDFLSPAVKDKRRFEQMLDEHVALGLNRGIDVLIEQVNYFLDTYQRPNEFNVNNETVTGNMMRMAAPIIDSRLGPTEAAVKVVNTVSSHTKLLNGNTDKTTLDVFLQEVGLRLYSSIGKHIKRQTIAVEGGAVLLISDLNYYYRFVETSLRQRPLLPYFAALREIAQLYLIDAKSAREIGVVMSEIVQKFAGIVTAEDVLEYVQRRADWILVKRDVEKAVYGLGLTDCIVM